MKKREKIQNILVGITGSIAAYKTIFLISQLRKEGYNIKCVLTKSATHFVTPLTLQTLSQNKVFSDNFAADDTYIEHIQLVKWADLMIIAPATANFIAKAACGIADDMLTSLFLAMNYNKQIIVAPAMNIEMWNNPLTQKNLSTLKNYDITILSPTFGLQACGDIGVGRMMEPNDIFEYIINLTNKDLPFKDKTILITAGPTLEKIDPIRYISNYSSGKMGYALAKAAMSYGAKVILVTGPTHIPKPNCTIVETTTADEMYQEVSEQIKHADIFISTAAVSDYKPKNQSSTKIKKDQPEIKIELVKNPDILKEIAKKHPNKFLVGFAAETCNLEENAIKKLKEKNLDVIIANHSSALNSDKNEVVIINKQEQKKHIPSSSKEEIAQKIMQYIIQTK